MKLITYLKELGASTVKLIHGPDGAFIKYKVGDEERTTPVCKKSQKASLKEFNVCFTDDEKSFATIHEYKQLEEIIPRPSITMLTSMMLEQEQIEKEEKKKREKREKKEKIAKRQEEFIDICKWVAIVIVVILFLGQLSELTLGDIF